MWRMGKSVLQRLILTRRTAGQAPHLGSRPLSSLRSGDDHGQAQASLRVPGAQDDHGPISPGPSFGAQIPSSIRTGAL